MKITDLELLKQSFGKDTQKMKDFIIASEIDAVNVNNKTITSNDFYNNIEMYVNHQVTDNNQQTNK